jgi:hypothetical protein
MGLKLTERAVTSIRKNNFLIGRLISEFNRGQNTIENWYKSENSPLTTPKGIGIISEETGLLESEILESVEETKVAS